MKNIISIVFLSFVAIQLVKAEFDVQKFLQDLGTEVNALEKEKGSISSDDGIAALHKVNAAHGGIFGKPEHEEAIKYCEEHEKEADHEHGDITLACPVIRNTKIDVVVVGGEQGSETEEKPQETEGQENPEEAAQE